MKLMFPVIFVLMFVFAVPAEASKMTHALGTTNYMIREARLVKAYKKDRYNYYKAVSLQKQAKRYFRGTAKGGRNLDKAFELTKQAYDHAKQARDAAAPEKYRYSTNFFDRSLLK